MVGRLEYPDYVSKKGEALLSIQINSDDLEFGWGDAVRIFTAQWVRTNNFRRKATVWAHGQLSVDFQTVVPILADFIVQCGLPARFIDEIYRHMCKQFGEKSFRFDYIAFEGYGSWSPVCHIEQGKAWEQDGDPNIWIPILVGVTHEEKTPAPQPGIPISETIDKEVLGDDGNDTLPQTPSGAKKTKLEPTGHPPRRSGRMNRHAKWGADLCDVRDVFQRGGGRSREEAVVQLKRRTGDQLPEIRKVLRLAVRRGVISQTDGGELRIGARTITAYKKEFLKAQFVASMGRRGWQGLEDSIRTFANSLGFHRTGSTFKKTTLSLVRGLIREDRIERRGPLLRRIE